VGKVIYYVAMSVDGMIADPDGGVGWLEAFEGPEHYGYEAFYGRLGALVMGSGTYEWFLKAGVSWPYAGLEAVVMTRQEFPQPPGGSVRFAAGSPDAIVRELKAKHDKDIWLVGGGRLAAAFAERELIDEYALTTIPIVLGGGVPLLGPLPRTARRQSLALVELRSFADGVLHVRYVVQPPP
jgi:dihydrofolate reductase